VNRTLAGYTKRVQFPVCSGVAGAVPITYAT
jgi:hypothetical protein